MLAFPTSPEGDRTLHYCHQWHPQPYLAFALSVLALFGTLITYRLDTQSQLQDQDQKKSPAPPNATCGKLLCLPECVSTMTHMNMSAIPSLSSTYCSSVRFIRNVRAITVIIGFIYLIFSITYLSLDKEDPRKERYKYINEKYFKQALSSKWSLLPAHIYSLLLWLSLIISTIHPSVTHLTQYLYPVLRVVLTLIPALGLVSWSVLDTTYAVVKSAEWTLWVTGNHCTLRLAPAA